MQLAGVALVLRSRPEAGDAAPLVVGVGLYVQADGVVDAEPVQGVLVSQHGLVYAWQQEAIR